MEVGSILCGSHATHITIDPPPAPISRALSLPRQVDSRILDLAEDRRAAPGAPPSLSAPAAMRVLVPFPSPTSQLCML
jgi:hypothetical protein